MGKAELAKAFGQKVLEQVGEIVKQESAKPVNEDQAKDVTYIPIHTSLAPSFGKEEKLADYLKGMDEKLKILIAVSMKEVEKLPKDKLDWSTIQGTFAANPSAQPKAPPVSIVKEFKKTEDNWFKFKGDPDPSKVNEVITWWESEAVTDPDIRADTKIKIEEMAKIVAWSGATVTGLPTLIYKDEYHEKMVIDIGVLRFPDMDHPYFKLYRLQVKAWSQCTRYGPAQKDTNGIKSILDYQCFEPRAEFIKDMHKETKDKANDYVDGLFN